MKKISRPGIPFGGAGVVFPKGREGEKAGAKLGKEARRLVEAGERRAGHQSPRSRRPERVGKGGRLAALRQPCKGEKGREIAAEHGWYRE